ncbi:phosphoglycerate kinase [Nitratiruptor sp. SB155-2]|uniref:Phosphoglycerate kinase n=2 Tax=Nitratiruptor sp. (strain SB155-2) TaxID=387092 RepID=PGK_NITSB|nr:phosphoglycerate kinase [Nitratiruptor sp. SB155-2]A6Q539.1 RecName: Full=Phosphoglycerate kinase [Nitratiruptor sp. SB155-2]BAF70598.1 phosphoglycerate kinase [Nitratiruptor sp. SB155-2]
MNIKSIKDLDLKPGNSVFIRCDFNVPLDEYGNITDDRRIREALPTIRYCLDNDCKIVLGSHLGRPKGFDEKYSLKPVAKRLHTLLKQDIIMAQDVVGEDAKAKFTKLQPGEILLLENLRFEPGETKNDEEFAKKLSQFGEFYVNDAFGVSHRAHASVEAITRFYDQDHKAAGFLLLKEIKYLYKILENPTRPFMAIVGGSKVSGKLGALINLLPKVDKLIIGGAMAFTFLKALGYEVGKSLVEDDLIEEAKNILNQAKNNGVKLYLPVDFVVAPELDPNAPVKYVTFQEIPKTWMGLDIGPASTRLFKEALDEVQTIIWNGPMGVFEIDKFARGSIKLANFVAESFATKIIGGGDTASLISKAGVVDEMTFISTGGGASLELLEGKELPGIKALEVGAS